MVGINHSPKLVLEHSDVLLELPLDHGVGVQPVFELHVVGGYGAFEMRNQFLRLLVLLKLGVLQVLDFGTSLFHERILQRDDFNFVLRLQGSQLRLEHVVVGQDLRDLGLLCVSVLPELYHGPVPLEFEHLESIPGRVELGLDRMDYTLLVTQLVVFLPDDLD